MADITTPSAVRKLLEAHGLAPNKKLGQHFLVDKAVLERILEAARLNGKETVLEVGPGLGLLTEQLAHRAARVVAVEIDAGYVRLLKERLAGFSNLEVVHGDALKVDLGRLSGEGTAHAVKVVANPPYYITSPLTIRLVREVPFELMVLMVQREVAGRMLARPGTKEYGYLTVLLGYHAEAEVVCPVSAASFYPRPEVDSAVLRIVPRSVKPHVSSEILLWQVVKASFSRRRKTLLNALTGGGFLGGNKTLLAEALRGIDINPEVRGEELGVDDYVLLANALYRFEQR